tara:strand:+ start:158 stop:379 length:222 start_codon:yes stop_codon:yes gene_type:complete
MLTLSIYNIYKVMQENLRQIAITLISQYGEEASTIAMLRAAEYAASLNTVEWLKWEEIIKLIENMDSDNILDS